MNNSTPPFGVSLIAAIVWVTGAWGLFKTGRLMWSLWDANATEASGGYPVVFTAVVVGFIVNLVIVSLAGALRRGSRGARVIVTIVLVIHVIFEALMLFANVADTATTIALWIALALNLIALLMLWVSGRAFFAKQPSYQQVA